MKILLLGATGRTGKLVLKFAKENGNEINCLVRAPGKIENDKSVQIFQGNAFNTQDLEKAIMGCGAIISTLNISRNSDFPWAKLRTPKTYLSDVMANVIPLAKKYNIRRLIICSAWGVAETKNDLPKWFRWFIDNSNIGVAYKDHERQERLLKKSDLNWTIIRPTGLVNSKREQKLIESYLNTPKPRLTISRQSVARYMVDAVENENLIGKVVTISKG